MVTTTVDSSSNHHSPTGAAAETANFSRKNLPSPWAQVVRGADTEHNHQSPPSSSSSSASLDSVNSTGPAVDTSCDAAVKPAWKRPSNGVVEVGPVMGAVSWPALSESTKPTAKLTSDSSVKTTTDDGSLTTPQGPVISESPQKEASGDAKPSPAMNHGMSNRQRSMKRGGTNSNHVRPGPAQSNFSSPSPNLPPPPPPPPFPVLQIPPGSFAHSIPGVPVPSPRDPFRNNNWDPRPPLGGFMPPMNEHRNPSRRGNAGHHLRGDGPYHNSYGNRRDQDRGSYANNRDAHVNQQRMPPRGLMRPPQPNPAPFMGPQPMRPFANPAGFPEFFYFPTLQFEPFGGMPFFTHAPPAAMFYPVAETPLTNTIVNQIDYYFSDANLVKDEYLRSNMDEHGWVPITLIASFPRVRSLTSNVKLILDSLRTSIVVEVQGDKLRRRNEWMEWLPSAQLRAKFGSISPGGSSSNNLAADFEKITLDESSTMDKVDYEPASNDAAASTTEFTGQSQVPNGDANVNRN